MFPNSKLIHLVVGLVLIFVAAATNTARAISVDLAKKCDALTAKAFPPREPGNPAAGSTKGTGADQQAYFKKCVANKGKTPDQSQ
jgi:hypothetical protein